MVRKTCIFKVIYEHLLQMFPNLKRSTIHSQSIHINNTNLTDWCDSPQTWHFWTHRYPIPLFFFFFHEALMNFLEKLFFRCHMLKRPENLMLSRHYEKSFFTLFPSLRILYRCLPFTRRNTSIKLLTLQWITNFLLHQSLASFIRFSPLFVPSIGVIFVYILSLSFPFCAQPKAARFIVLNWLVAFSVCFYLKKMKIFAALGKTLLHYLHGIKTFLASLVCMQIFGLFYNWI